MKLPLAKPPRTICLLRLSAVGDVSHTVPVLRTLQAAWPTTRITWIIGRVEHSLIGDITGVEFIIFDKGKRWRAYRDIRYALRGRRFDLLLHMQMSLRASLLSLLVRADIKLGFDRERAKDMQWLFTNQRIDPGGREHVLDSLLGFPRALGIGQAALRWDIPIPEAAERFADLHVDGGRPLLVLSPCSSMAYRNWTARGYAAVGDHAVAQHSMQVVISGGPTPIEREYGTAISALMRHPPLDLVGSTDLKQLLAVLRRAAVVIAPDSGTAHLATAVGTPVIGLYACTNPARARPYFSGDYVVSRYSEAVLREYGKPVDDLPWGIRVRTAGTMDLITVADVVAQLDRVMAARCA